MPVESFLAAFSEPSGQGWAQIGQLALALCLSSLIGLERELRQRSAGMRTHALVGVASALMMLVSKYGFTDVLANDVILDPSRVAAQIVSGIGFIGAGLIFVRRDSVRGLTTAATIWLTAGVGMAAGAGLPLLACFVTAAHFVVVYAFTPVVGRLEQLSGPTVSRSGLHVAYRDGEGILRVVLALCTEQGFTVSQLTTEQPSNDQRELGIVSIALRVAGARPVEDLVAALASIGGVLGISLHEAEDDD